MSEWVGVADWVLDSARELVTTLIRGVRPAWTVWPALPALDAVIAVSAASCREQRAN